ncbi:YggT family protein [Methylomonas sp. AM2-LC]|uniref:YggT family protein n=1 Tax=Methylomonas sp. AM2-LC TaxID=3153301 RepID=UPI0032638E35
MGSNYMTDPVVFLIDTLFSLYILAVLLRFLLQTIRADFYNPVSQFLVKITHPPLRILRRFVPAIGRVDSSSLLLALLLQMLANFSILALKGVGISFVALTLLSFTDLLKILLDIYVYAIFAGALLSWFAPGNYNSVASILYSLTDPLLNICRKVLPDLGGIDLSPLVALVVLHLAKMMILPPLQQLASLLS